MKNNFNYKRFFLLVLLVAGTQLFSITYGKHLFKSLRPGDGLSQSEVRYIFKDSRGFMWFGTSDGLNRYDGYTFKIFKNNPSDTNSIISSTIESIYEDKNGLIWVGTIKGLSIYHPNEEIFRNIVFINENNKAATTVNAIIQDNKGNMWVGTQRGLYRCRLHENNSYSYSRGDFVKMSHYNADDLKISKLGGLLIGSWDCFAYIPPHEINRDSISEITVYDTIQGYGIPNNGVVEILEDEDGSLWLGTSLTGLWHLYPAGKFSNLDVYTHDVSNNQSISNNYITGICYDRYKNIWVSTQDGVNKMEKSSEGITFERFKYDELNPESISHDNIYHMTYDNTGLLWFGTMGGGVNYVDFYRKPFRKNKIPALDEVNRTKNFIRVIKEDYNKNLWFGTFDNKLIYLDRNTSEYSYIQVAPGKQQLSGTQVFDIFVQNRNKVFVATIGHNGSLYELDYSDINNPNIVNTGKVGSTFSVHGYDGVIYKGGWNNFGRITKIGDQFDYQPINLEPNNPVRSIVPDRTRNCLWIATLTEGLVKGVLDEQGKLIRFVHFTPVPNDTLSISNATVRDICVARDGVVWVGTNNGLNKVIDHPDDNTIKFKRYFVEDGLPNTRVQSIVEDGKGQLWIGTVNGLSRLNPMDEEFVNYDVNDGLSNNEFVESSKTITRDGEIIFGNINGYTSFNPDDIVPNPHDAKPVITELFINNKLVKAGDKINNRVIMKESILNTNEIVLTRKENSFSITFAALHYSAPKKNLFRYKLENFNDDWITVNYEKRTATYTNLKGGKYQFKVSVSNCDKEWNDELLATLDIRIKRPFWKTKVFYLLIFLVFATLVYLFMRYRDAKTKNDQRVLEEKIKEGEKQVRQKVKELEYKQLEIKERAEREHELNYLNGGLARFSEILSKNKDDLDQLSQVIINELVRYLGAIQGVLFIVNEDDPENPRLQLRASYARDDKYSPDQIIEIGEGYVGTSFRDGQVIRLQDIPENYTKIASGLGKGSPKHLVVVPIQQDEMRVGVIEVASFDKIEKFKIDFLLKLCQNITSTFLVEKANRKAKELLALNRSQTEELRSQEEEMRQNLEEMLATQEEAQRREELNLQKISELEAEIKQLKEADSNEQEE
ncbi:MAG: GAF domain-containing protein [Bacteroidales bacterium]|nr:GAF domain-containing protein [Bacteroidales bacterium]